MFEHLYPKAHREILEHASTEPLGCYVSFTIQRRDRLIALTVGILIGLAAGAVLFMLGAAS